MKLSKILNTKKSKLFFLYIIFGILSIIFGAMLMPIWAKNKVDVFFASWGGNIIKIVIALLLGLYLAFYLFKKLVSPNKKVIKFLIVLEFTTLLLILFGCIFAQFNIIKINNAGSIIGLVFWLRGSIEVFRAYYYEKGDSSKYSVWGLIVAILFISFGVALMVGRFLKDEFILWSLVILIFIIGLVSCFVGFIKKPIKNKQKKGENNVKQQS